MNAELTDAVLSREVALACGWVVCTQATYGRMGIGQYIVHRDCEHDRCWNPEGPPAVQPHYTTSLDACFGPGGPVEKLHDMGLYPVLSLMGDGSGGCRIRKWPETLVTFSIFDHEEGTLPRALCLAMLAAVRAQP